VDLVPEPVSVGGESDDVAVGEVCDDEAFPREGDVHRVRQAGGRVQRAKQVTESRVHQNWAVCKKNAMND
jgi:hypothetical protein